jgi:hypothetical protein
LANIIIIISMASMEAKDIEERGRQLAKAAAGGDPPATLLSLLDGLKGWTATEKLLRQTRLGVHVNKLRQNGDAQVARTASSLVNKWKADVKKTPATATSSGTNSPAPGGKSSPAPAAKQKSQPHADPEKRNSLSDKVNCNVTGNQTRDACIKLLYDGLAFMSPDGMYMLACCSSLYSAHQSLTCFVSLAGHLDSRSLSRACRLQRLPARRQSRIPPTHTLSVSKSQEQVQPKAP